MIEFSLGRGAVYIFENPKDQRVKVGLTINAHDITSRLNDLNDIWSERKVRCQICGTRIVRFGFTIPPHVLSGIKCPGGNALPLEKSTTLADSYLHQLKIDLPHQSGSQKGSTTIKIKTLEK